MNSIKFKELITQDLIEVSGGHVPISWYTDDATIAANGRNISFFGGVFAGLGGSLLKKVRTLFDL
ncbi:MAG: hypothetical protein PHF34_03415 [Bacteroidales bacterium]|jgi:hypothetical protein|nr:hypothetical protein [Bacteroidales bacterium]